MRLCILGSARPTTGLCGQRARGAENVTHRRAGVGRHTRQTQKARETRVVTPAPCRHRHPEGTNLLRTKSHYSSADRGGYNVAQTRRCVEDLLYSYSPVVLSVQYSVHGHVYVDFFCSFFAALCSTVHTVAPQGSAARKRRTSLKRLLRLFEPAIPPSTFKCNELLPLIARVGTLSNDLSNWSKVERRETGGAAPSRERRGMVARRPETFAPTFRAGHPTFDL